MSTGLSEFIAAKIVEAESEVESLQMQLRHARRLMFDSDLADLRVQLRRARVNLSRWRGEKYRNVARGTAPTNWPKPA